MHNTNQMAYPNINKVNSTYVSAHAYPFPPIARLQRKSLFQLNVQLILAWSEAATAKTCSDYNC